MKHNCRCKLNQWNWNEFRYELRGQFQVIISLIFSLLNCYFKCFILYCKARNDLSVYSIPIEFIWKNDGLPAPLDYHDKLIIRYKRQFQQCSRICWLFWHKNHSTRFYFKLFFPLENYYFIACIMLLYIYVLYPFQPRYNGLNQMRSILFQISI